jgi:hypothetical protein
MGARLPLAALLLCLVGLDAAAGRPNLPLAAAGGVLGLALAVTVVLDALSSRLLARTDRTRARAIELSNSAPHSG